MGPLSARRPYALSTRPGVSHVLSARPERAEAPSPGQSPWEPRLHACRPERAKALKYRPFCNISVKVLDLHQEIGAF